MEPFEVVKEMNFMIRTAEMEKERNNPEPILYNGVIWHYPCGGCNKLAPQGCDCPPPVPMATESLNIEENL